ncbi:ABC transporter ATP-binding protein [Leadbettera azotonutricia]|uniref:Nitrate transport ATP-binding protein NrtC n=1 Tax=Leadbettera azotonutricia (strain ATCC BAA-888 / DSM 13862 / ZAS-9) TaxID=545695 RepID=F5YEK9_LEAAZ|nr:ABC transporter ATP-binding protein [Leadbettera azotonutricia]AEF80245.1 nitrate transport ATP-binding protein NrtC [Leadbettera azotonutricia ZAS-9]
MSGNVFIDIKKVNRVYRDTNGNPLYALKDIDLEIAKGEFVSIVGPSGCGKTTLLRLIAGLDRPQSGSLAIEGQEITRPSHEQGYVFQQSTLFPWASVHDNVAMGLKARGIYKGREDQVKNYIDMIGLTGFEKSYPHEISGGMAQRVAIIRALINEPKVLLLDEPLGALDAFKRIELQALLLDVWTKTNTTMVMVTHDVDEAISLSTRIVIMTPRPGQITDIFDVNLGERDRNNDDFIELRKKILEVLHIAISQPQVEYNL